MEKEDGTNPEPRILNVHEVASFLRISEAKAYKMARAGDLPALRMGKSWRFPSDLINEWIRHQAQKETQPSR